MGSALNVAVPLSPDTASRAFPVVTSTTETLAPDCARPVLSTTTTTSVEVLVDCATAGAASASNEHTQTSERIIRIISISPKSYFALTTKSLNSLVESVLAQRPTLPLTGGCSTGLLAAMRSGFGGAPRRCGP